MQLQITGTRPFSTASNQPCLGINFNLNGQPHEGVVWGHALQNAIVPGSLIEVKEDNSIKWDDYKGKSRLNIRDRASITILGGPVAAPAPQAYQPAQPAQTAYQAPQQAYTPPQQAYVPDNTQGAEPTGEAVLSRGAELTAFYAQKLEQNGFTREEAVAICGNAPIVVSSWWFGKDQKTQGV